MAARKLRRHAGEHDLVEAYGQPGCPVCRLTTESVDAYLTAVCYEQVNDLDLREQLRSAGGFCRVHAERFLRQRLGQLAAAIVYRDVLSTARKRIAGSAGQGARSKISALFGARPARRPAANSPRCPGCEAKEDADRRYLSVVCASLRNPAALERYRSGDGLCLPHLDRALQSEHDGAQILAETAVQMLVEIVDDLDEYIRKHDYRFQTAVWNGGEDTPERAVERAVGHQPPPTLVP